MPTEPPLPLTATPSKAQTGFDLAPDRAGGKSNPFPAIFVELQSAAECELHSDPQILKRARMIEWRIHAPFR